MAEEDLIFGKNRHLFGGIEPSNMLAFNAEISNNAVTITASLPSNTVVNGYTLCNVEGAIIRRKTTDYPRNEFDGVLVADIKTSTVFIDTDALITGSYYYTAFPYTRQGVYNRSTANRAVINEIQALSVFSVESVYVASTNTVNVEITTEIPDNFAGVMIRKSIASYPMTELEGELVTNISSSGLYTDENVTVGAIYYYSAFPYTSDGSYNCNEKNRASVVPKRGTYVYGYDLVKSVASPTKRVSYPSDVDNVAYTPAAMNYTTGVFDYGGWNIAPGKKFMPRPCVLWVSNSLTQEILEYLDPDDYSKNIDGDPSAVTRVTNGINVMMEWPKIYTKRWEENGVYHFRCSDAPQDDEYDCWCNYDKNNDQIDHFYTAVYSGTLISTTLRSVSGQTNSVKTTAVNERTYAKSNGNGWDMELLSDRLLIQDLLVMMSRSTDGQTAFGYGRGNGALATDAIKTGTMDAKGMFWGSNDGVSGVKVFGMENLWGNIFRRIAGYMYVGGVQKIKITQGTHDGSLITDYNFTGNGYISVADSGISGTIGGYISEMVTTKFGRLPVKASGSSTTYEADHLNFNNNNGTYCAFLGSAWSNSVAGGPFSTLLGNSPSDAFTSHGASISYKPVAGTLT